MVDRLIMHFDGAQAAWLDANGTLVRGSPDDAAQAAGEREVIVLLPAEHILLTRVRLPPIRQARRRLQAARYALEDQLISRVDDLHFAPAPRASVDGDTVIAVIDHARIADLVNTLRAANLDAFQLGADALALPPPAADEWQVAVIGNRVLARTGPDHAFAGELSLWPALAAGCPPPERLLLCAGDEDTARRAASLDLDPAPDIRNLVLEDDDAVLARLLADAHVAGLINLRQGAFARTSAAQSWWQPFRLTAGLAAAWLMLAIAARGIESWQLNNRVDDMQAASETAFRDAFPDVQTINDLRVQAEQNIRALRGAGGSSGIFALLQATAEVTGQAGDIHIRAMQYRDDTLYLSLRGKNVQALESLRAGFARQPSTQLDVESADAAADGVQIRARVRGAGA